MLIKSKRVVVVFALVIAFLTLGIFAETGTQCADESNVKIQVFDEAPLNARDKEEENDTDPPSVEGMPGLEDDEDFFWNLSEEGVLTIGGNGDIPPQFSYEGFPWAKNTDKITSVVIEEGITHIFDNAFDSCVNLTDVKIPNSVKSIGYGAFYNCTSLSEIVISENIEMIDAYAFYGCTSLTEVHIPDSVTNVGYSAFENCTGLTEVTIPGSVKSSNVFRGCENIVKITFTDTVTSIVDRMFYGYKKLEEVILSDNIESIGKSAFGSCTSLRKINFPDSLLIIDELAFNSCTALEGIELPGNLQSIGSYAFYNCVNLTKANITDSIQSIGNSAFGNCTGLEEITITGAVMNSYNVFYGCTNVVKVTFTDTVTSISNKMFSKYKKLEEVIVSSSVKSIGYEAFRECSNLKRINIPEGVESIGESAFADCVSLTEIHLPDSVVSIGPSAFGSCTGLEEITVNTAAMESSWTFFGCSNIEKITFSNSVTAIADGAFGGLGKLREVIIPDNVTSIGSSSFASCSSLEKVTMPDNLDKIGIYAFTDCTSLKEIEIPEGVTVIGNGAFSGCSALTSIIIPGSVKSIEGDYYGGTFRNCIGLKNVTINEGVTSIGPYSFYGCTGLENIKIPQGVKTIGDLAFFNCSNIKSIEIPQSVTSLGDGAFMGCAGITEVIVPGSIDTIRGSIWNGTFRNCTGLVSLVIQDGVKIIQTNAFQGCTSLTEIILPDSITSLGSNAFSECTSITKATLSKGLLSIETSTFRECKGLEEVIIPNSITVIGDYAFSGCTNLSEINFPENLTTIGADAFSGCTNITEITVPNSVTSIGERAFLGCAELKKAELPVSAATPRIFENCPKLVKIILTGNGNKIYAYAFYSFTALEEIIIPNSVTSIEESAFNGCTNLSEINFPENLTTIGADAFSGCTNITEITVPNSVTSIGERAFLGCAELKKAELPVSAATPRIFENCPKLVKIILTGNGNKIYAYAFYNLTALEEITIPESVTSIGPYAFANCSSLCDVTIPSSAESIEDGTFSGCTNLQSIIIEDGVKAINGKPFPSSLANITIPQSVEYISNNAFSSCTNVTIYCPYFSYAEQYATDHEIPYELIKTETPVSVLVTGSDGHSVANGYIVNWYEKGSDKIIATGKKLSGYDKEKEYEYEIVLGEELVRQYYSPERQPVVITDDSNKITCQLKAIPTLRAGGTITDANNNPLPGVTVTFTHVFDSNNSLQTTVTTDNYGSVILDIPYVKTMVKVTLQGYYSRSFTIIENVEENMHYVSCDVSLVELPKNKITITVNKTSSVLNDETPVVSEIKSLDNIEFSVFNRTQNMDIPNYEIQDMKIILPDTAVCGGDVIEITAVDKKKQMIAETVAVTLDNAKIGSARIDFVECGKIRLNGVTGNLHNILMLFDGNGKYIKTYDVGAFIDTESFEEGDYSLVLMKKTSLLRSVSSIDKLSVLGFVLGTDYTRIDVSVTNGVITEINHVNVPVFDENKFKYTVDENTSFVASPAETIAGQYVIMRLSYEIDTKYSSSNEIITIEIPDGVVFVEDSLSFNSKTPLYSVDGNTLKVHTYHSGGVVRFYVLPLSDGEYSVNGYLNFTTNNEELCQTVGEAVLNVQSQKIKVPEITSTTAVFVSGKTVPNANVWVYDNNVPVGTTVSNRAGNWSLTFDLVNPMNYSLHNISAEITSSRFGDGSVVKTQSEELIYDCYYINLSKVTMYNTGDNGENITVFDFLNPSPPGSYRMYPGVYTKFTFVIEFEKSDATQISDVSLNVYLNSGEVRTFIPDYNALDDTYIVTADFKTFEEAPVNVAVNYTSNNKIFDYSILDVDALPESDKNYIKAMQVVTDELLEVELKEDTDEYITVNCIMSEEDGIGWEMQIRDLDYYEFDISSLIEQGFELCESDNPEEKPQYFKMQITDGYVSYILVDEEYEYAVEFSIPDICFDTGASLYSATLFGDSDSEDLVTAENIKSVFDLYMNLFADGKVADIIQEVVDTAFYVPEKFNAAWEIEWLSSYLNKKRNEIQPSFTHVVGLISARCPDGKIKLSPEDIRRFSDRVDSLQRLEETHYEACDAQIELFKQKFINAFVFDAITAGVCTTLKEIGFVAKTMKNGKPTEYWIRNKSTAKIINKVSGVALNYTVKKLNEMMDAIDLSGIKEFGKEIGPTYLEIQDILYSLERDIKRSYRNCEQEEEEYPDNNNRQYDNNNRQYPYSTPPVLDPSGYVYEAVPSNRVEGVKAECYYYDYPIDEFGMPGEDKEDIFWDAENYDQINPLYTDKSGMYQWDVPMGEWLVKFSKDGYYDTDSKKDAAANENGYLPVPPPQTEVNTAIVSKSAPKIKAVNVYNNEVDIIFSQYMQPDTVNTNNVKIFCNNTEITGSITPLNLEYDYYKEYQYASMFTFVPVETLTENVTVEVENVKNYAGTVISGKQVKSKSVVVKPENLSVNSKTEVAFNSGALIEICVLPKEAGANKTLTVTSSTPSIAQVVNTKITTDENGKATAMISGKLPGESVITILLDGTVITAQTRAIVGNVVSNDNKCAKVTANIQSGSTVEKGTEITLSTETEGADIYYTLDGTCPCIEESASRIKYTSPIEINDDTFVIAYAVKEGLESSVTTGLVYNVQKIVNHDDVNILAEKLLTGADGMTTEEKDFFNAYEDYDDIGYPIIDIRDLIKLAQLVSLNQ